MNSKYKKLKTVKNQKTEKKDTTEKITKPNTAHLKD